MPSGRRTAARLLTRCGSVVAGIALASCTHTRVPLPPPDLPAAAHATVSELRDTVHALVDAGGSNTARGDAVWRRIEALGLAGFARREGIDWFSLQTNIVLELPGTTDEIAYASAHFDKIDANPLILPSILLNGVLDPLVSWSFTSEGAVDNASGVAVLLSAAHALSRVPHRRTYRFLFAGAEEVGLRGSRSHVAQIPEDVWSRVRLNVNVDSVGLAGEPNCVTTNVGDPRLVRKAREVAQAARISLDSGEMPIIGSSDFAPFERTGFFVDFGRGLLFNFVGGVLPQRSWFTQSRELPVVNFSACHLMDAGTWLSSTCLVPSGKIHGPRDRADALDPLRLLEIRELLVALLLELEMTPAE